MPWKDEQNPKEAPPKEGLPPLLPEPLVVSEAAAPAPTLDRRGRGPLFRPPQATAPISGVIQEEPDLTPTFPPSPWVEDEPTPAAHVDPRRIPTLPFGTPIVEEPATPLPLQPIPETLEPAALDVPAIAAFEGPEAFEDSTPWVDDDDDGPPNATSVPIETMRSPPPQRVNLAFPVAMPDVESEEAVILGDEPEESPAPAPKKRPVIPVTRRVSRPVFTPTLSTPPAPPPEPTPAPAGPAPVEGTPGGLLAGMGAVMLFLGGMTGVVLLGVWVLSQPRGGPPAPAEAEVPEVQEAPVDPTAFADTPAPAPAPEPTAAPAPAPEPAPAPAPAPVPAPVPAPAPAPAPAPVPAPVPAPAPAPAAAGPSIVVPRGYKIYPEGSDNPVRGTLAVGKYDIVDGAGNTVQTVKIAKSGNRFVCTESGGRLACEFMAK